MAQAAIQTNSFNDTLADEKISQWQNLFGYTRAEAIHQIEGKRRDLGGRVTISDALWDTISFQKTAEGYNKASYEHSCWLAQTTTTPNPSHRGASIPMGYLFNLDGPLSDHSSLNRALGGPEINHLNTFTGQDDSGQLTTFCRVDTSARDKIFAYLDTISDCSYNPVCIRDQGKTEKSLSSNSIHPTLGLEPTLPQHPLIDSRRPDNKAVKIWAFVVKNQEWEDALRRYETELYKVVRCEMWLDMDMWGNEVYEIGVKGLTFRFVGEVDD
ncbi:hypothetical protein QBC38DRAFT_518243 [Podospora fimiseda]|uniref:Uncharacterized protein n=1 Tax=Podospora fimiseda TaxID=252190 RepID=A0AAN6YRY9_9PEZI|nr:hypothetical protein QBC38DRAFT_518243 [Podospora fimiseda]